MMIGERFEASNPLTKVGMVGGQLVGPELEVRMLEASGYHFAKEGARSFAHSSGARVDVVRALEFDHDRMTSGALVRARVERFDQRPTESFELLSNQILLKFCKIS